MKDHGEPTGDPFATCTCVMMITHWCCAMQSTNFGNTLFFQVQFPNNDQFISNGHKHKMHMLAVHTHMRACARTHTYTMHIHKQSHNIDIDMVIILSPHPIPPTHPQTAAIWLPSGAKESMRTGPSLLVNRRIYFRGLPQKQ